MKEKIYITLNNNKIKEVNIPENMLHPEICDFIDELLGGNDNWKNYSTEI